jgi:hypothetical protein
MMFTNHSEPLRLNNLISILYSIKSKNLLREQDEQVEQRESNLFQEAKKQILRV